MDVFKRKMFRGGFLDDPDHPDPGMSALMDRMKPIDPSLITMNPSKPSFTIPDLTEEQEIDMQINTPLEERMVISRLNLNPTLPVDNIKFDPAYLPDFSEDLAQIGPPKPQNIPPVVKLGTDPSGNKDSSEVVDKSKGDPKIGSNVATNVQGSGTTGTNTNKGKKTGSTTTVVDKNENVGGFKNIANKASMVNFFGSDKFLDIVRSVGKGLSAAGQFGTGLTAGAELFAAGEDAKRAAERELEAKKELIRYENQFAQGLDPDMQKYVMDAQEKLIQHYTNMRKSADTIELIKQLQKIVSTNDVTSLRAIADTAFARAGSFFGTYTPENFAKLPPRIKAETIANNIKNINVREILGESGRTISNLDREIVAKVVADFKPGATDAEIEQTLELTRSNLENTYNSARSNLTSLGKNIQQIGGTAYIQTPEILEFLSTGKIFTVDPVSNAKVPTNPIGGIESEAPLIILGG